MAVQPDLFDVGQRRKKERPNDQRCTPGRSGDGPPGETCGSCTHCFRRVRPSKKVFLKCALTAPYWTRGEGTDIKARWPACDMWSPLRSIEELPPDFVHITDAEDWLVIADYWEERGDTTRAFLARRNAVCEPPF